jgi:hypothetical protein
MPVEKLVESFTVTGVTNLDEKRKEKPEAENKIQEPGQNAVAPPPQPPVTPPPTSPQQEAEWDTAYINDLPDSSFAVVEPTYPEKTQDKRCRHLPFKDKAGNVDLPHLRNALARMNQIEPVTDSISTADLRARSQKVLIAAAKDAGVGDYELQAKVEGLQETLQALRNEITELKKPKPEPQPVASQGPKEPCKCVLTKEGFWARFHQLRSEGLDKADAFRIVSHEVLEAAAKKSQ